MGVDVVVLAWSHDSHVTSVIRHLDAGGVTSVCIDQVSLWRDTVMFDPAGPRLTVGGGEIGSCSLIWNRRAYPPHLQHLSGGDRKFARAEFAHALFGALRALSSRWFNTPEAISRASYKAAQLHRAARDRRLRIPASLVTSNLDAARAFIAARKSRHVIKPLYVPLIETDDGYQVVCTSLVDDQVLDNFADIRHAPCLIQEFIEPNTTYAST